jgi:predicted nucleotidyltransferase
MKEEQVLQSIRERLASLFEIERIVLFGSRATGKDSPESDWDVLVIAPSALPFVERQGRAMSALGPHDYPLDLLLYTPEEAKEAASIPGSAVYWAEREGREVYAK